jgi:hypothetical protein
MSLKNGKHTTAKAKIANSLDGVQFRILGDGKMLVVNLQGLQAKLGNSLKTSLITACNGKVRHSFRDKSVVFMGNGNHIASAISRITTFCDSKRKIHGRRSVCHKVIG